MVTVIAIMQWLLVIISYFLKKIFQWLHNYVEY